ncbi:MAG: cobalt-precorrin 5A hydrolase [Acidaminococcaceae bacterium]
MKAVIFSYTRSGAKLSLRIRNCLQKLNYATKVFTSEKYVNVDSSLRKSAGLNDAARKAFEDSQVIIYIGSCGIAVRAIAPFVKNKTVDPAVISVDEQGSFVIPLLSGHIGGANDIARKIAQEINAQAVITTATDINGLFAVDEWATKNNVYIGSLYAAKEVAAALVNGEIVGLISNYSITGGLPSGISNDEKTRVGIVIDDNAGIKTFPVTLNLLPKVYYLGIGCRRNTKPEAIERLVLQTIEELKININAVAGIASVDLKKDEEGLLAFAQKYKLPITFYTAAELESQQGEFSSSEFVQSIVGVSNVCERSAAAVSGGSRIFVPKRSQNGVTLAIAKKDWLVNFSK